MSALTLYALGTLALWVGFALLLFGIAKAAAERFNRETSRPATIVTPVIGLAGIAIGLLLSKPDAKGAGFALPLIWPVTSFWLWLTFAGVVMAGARMLQSLTALSAEEKKGRILSAVTWGFVALIGFGLANLTDDIRFSLVKGALPMTPVILALFLILATGAVISMVAIGRSAIAAGRAQAVAAQGALLIGTIVFGLPFAFLVITSFKEDRDMSSANGIVWIPKVQETVPYMDQKNPLYEADKDGQRVEGTIIEELPDGTVRIDIAKPLAIRGTTFVVDRAKAKEIPRQIPVVTAKVDGVAMRGKVIENMDDGRQVVEFDSGKVQTFNPTETEPVRNVGLRYQNYSEALSFMPPETKNGLIYLKNTLILVILSVLGTLLSSSVVAYAFSRLKFPGKEKLFTLLLATLMLPAAVTLLPQFLIFKKLGWIDTLMPLWVPAFFASAFNVFLLRQFFMSVPMELEDAAKMDGCSYLRTFWSVLLPQVKPALAVVAIWTFMGAWNNFIGPLIYINSPEQMPLSYALQLFQSDRGLGEPGLLMAFATLTMLPVLALFFFAQKYFIEGVSLSGLGGR